MKNELYCSKLLVKKSQIQGYGVFADQDIEKNDLIEEALSLRTFGNEEGLRNYYFSGDNDFYVVSFGYASLYNHSAKPNAHWEFDPAHSLITVRATQPIKKGEEIFISYGDDWFSGRKMQMRKLPLWYKYRRLIITFLKFVLALSVIVFFISLSRIMMMIMIKLF